MTDYTELVNALRCNALSKQCDHGKGGAANWYAWYNGDKTCLLYKSDKAKSKRAAAEGGDTN